MTEYLWVDRDNHGGDWNNPNNWETLTQPPPLGPPSAGDDVFITVPGGGTVTTDGATVASLTDVSGTILQGDLTVTGDLAGAHNQGGDVNAGQYDNSLLLGGTLSAASVSGSTIAAGSATIDELLWGTVTGGTVKVANLDIVDPNRDVEVNGGTVTVQNLALDGQFAFFAIGGGNTTVVSAATVDSPANGAAEIGLSGGRLNLEGGLTLEGGAHINDGSVAGQGNLGGIVSALSLTLGGTTSGSAFIGGANATITVTSDLILGEHGKGGLTVENGGHLIVNGNLEAAVNSGATATGTVSDAAANLAIAGDWELGIGGTASWTLDGATSTTVAGMTELGVSSGGNGSLTVSDAGTSLVTGGGGVIVGVQGSGTLILQSGAQLDDSADKLTLGEISGAKATMQINDGGSDLIVGGSATIGEAGSATLVIVGGAATMSGNLTLGEANTATGGLSVTDGGLTIAGDTVVGASGKGTLTVGPDGVVAPGALSIPTGASDTITLGENTTGKGTLTVEGDGASLTSFALKVGDAGGGTLNVTSNGKVLTTGHASVADAVTATLQKVNISSGGGWTVNGELELGEAAIGIAQISAGGQLRVGGDLDMGVDTAATGIIVVSGGLTTSGAPSPSRLQWGGVLDVGVSGTGELTVEGGAIANAIAGQPGLLELGSTVSGHGAVTVSGSGTQLRGQSLAIGGTLTSAGGAGTFTVSAGAVAQFAQSAAVWTGDQINVQSGTLTLGSTLNNGTLNTVGGEIKVTGGFTGTGAVTIGTGGLFVLDASKTAGANHVRIASSTGTFSLTGGSGADLFQTTIAALVAQDVINGGAGTDTLTFTTAGVIIATRFTHVTGIDVIRLATGDTSMTLTNALVTSSDGDHLNIIGGVGAANINASAVSGGVVFFNGATTTSTTFTAGAGTVNLIGGAGTDTFRFQANSLKAADVVVGGLGHDTLTFTTAGTIAATAFTAVSGIDQVDLAAGTNSMVVSKAMVSGSDANSLTIVGGSGNDTVNAAAVASGTLTFNGGAGADSIVGTQANNIYEVGKAAETLSITNSFAGGAAAHGSLLFGAGLTDQSLWFQQSGANLVIDVLGTNEKVTLNGWFGANKSAQVAEIQAGGLKIDANVAQLVSAMATFQAQNPSFNPTAAGTVMPTNAALQTAISTDWRH